MLELVTPQTRLAIVDSKRCAFSGNESQAISILDAAHRQAGLPEVDCAAILLTKAELLYLSGKYTLAHRVFSNQLDPLIPALPHSVALVIGLNRCDVAMSLYDSEESGRFYDLLDELEIAGIEHSDDSAMLVAARHAKKGRGYESLQAIWRDLLRTYRLARWTAFRQASRSMAEECMRLNAPADAAFHCAMACDSEFAKQLGVALLAARKSDMVGQTIEKLLKCANLQKHFKVACELIQTLSDAIPDSLIDRVIGWILPHTTGEVVPEDHCVCQQIAWITLGKLARRGSSEVATAIVAVAVQHTAWKEVAEKPNQYIRGREEIIDAVYETVPRLPKEQLDELVIDAIPLATERQNFKDFANAVNLLGHIVHCGSEQIRDKVKNALYPSGKPISPILIQLSAHFGHEIQNKDNQLEKYAANVAENIRRVVQWTPIGDKGSPVQFSYMTYTSTKESEQLLVHMISVEPIRALAQQRHKVPKEALAIVIQALLESITRMDNLLDNRIQFVDCLKEFADSINAEEALAIFKVLGPIAEGTLETSPDIPSGKREPHSLSRAHFEGTTREELISHALYVLGVIEHRNPGVFGDRLQSIVEEALSDDSPKIRKGAFAAVREIPSLNEGTWMPVILGTLDLDPEAASMAFDTIANKREARFTRPQWRMVVHSLKISLLSQSSDVRESAAVAVSSLLPQAPTKIIEAELAKMRDAFLADTSHRVRVAAAIQKRAFDEAPPKSGVAESS